ncbi:hypothetical protein RHGRI_009829 [Rhododendron griersonianum]|uniref:Uncharacterized protein n=1 Tax=Rhododendron griersonianum TaxID=479676 RepID=A0AAV6KH04_9ERIC|nr:hypothetical protein RHGRI_009829 [Rhododendron griersonianum]
MGSLEAGHDLKNGSTRVLNPLDPEEFRRQGQLIIDFLADYYKNIEKYPVRSQVEPGYLSSRLPDSAPLDPEPIETVMQDVENHIIPGITHWQSPNYFAYFPATASIAGFNGRNAARDEVLNRVGRESIVKLVIYGSDQTHSAVQKAARIAGINPENFRAIPTTKDNAFGLIPDSLESAILSDLAVGLIPLFLCAIIGTTSSTAVDPVGPLSNVARRYGVWDHVDAAQAGSAFICPMFRHFIDGIEGADSFSLNAHKWFFTNLDCCCLWVKDPNALIKALSTNPEFLRNKATESYQVVDYKDCQIGLSRRFRASYEALASAPELRSGEPPKFLGLPSASVGLAELWMGESKDYNDLHSLTPVANLLDRVPVFYNMTHLVLHSELFGDSFGVMIDLLENSPKLESLNFEEVRIYMN